MFVCLHRRILEPHTIAVSHTRPTKARPARARVRTHCRESACWTSSRAAGRSSSVHSPASVNCGSNNRRCDAPARLHLIHTHARHLRARHTHVRMPTSTHTTKQDTRAHTQLQAHARTHARMHARTQTSIRTHARAHHRHPSADEFVLIGVVVRRRSEDEFLARPLRHAHHERSIAATAQQIAGDQGPGE